MERTVCVGGTRILMVQNLAALSALTIFGSSTKQPTSKGSQCLEWMSCSVEPNLSAPLTSQRDTGRPPFSTPGGHWQYRVLPFGLHGAPEMFQHMIDILLQPHQDYVAAYLDNVVIHLSTGENHLTGLWRVLLELRQAGITANP